MQSSASIVRPADSSRRISRRGRRRPAMRNVAGPSIVVEGEGTVVELGDPKDTVRDLGRGTRVTRRVERP